MSQDMKMITAFGNVNLILQMVDFLSGNPTYRYNEEACNIRSSFIEFQLSDIYLICTQKSHEALPDLLKILGNEYPDISVHTISLGCDDIECAGDDRNMKGEVYRAVELLASDNLVISSGGRKTVTNRLIEAGLLYGCMGYLTMTAPAEEDTNIRQRSLEFNLLWISARQFSEERRKHIIKSELGDNFRSLYLLPATMIDRLRNETIGADPGRADEELAWLHRLPKADLHCHLGGAFDEKLLKKLATTLLSDLKVSDEKKEDLLKIIEKNARRPLSSL
ncbi:MAG: hypothetical protein HQK65_22420, partial [Desulfamplus sp.]|nr:hypothetical protein [Desulfamplus sp.]